jgi:hypothetical protein
VGSTPAPGTTILNSTLPNVTRLILAICLSYPKTVRAIDRFRSCQNHLRVPR